MAQQVKIVLVDDISGEPGDETVQFSVDGQTYEIDLTAKHATQLRDSMSEWVQHARKQRGGSAAKRQPRATRSDLDAIREWARKNGHQVSDRGRVANAIVEQYDARNS